MRENLDCRVIRLLCTLFMTSTVDQPSLFYIKNPVFLSLLAVGYGERELGSRDLKVVGGFDERNFLSISVLCGLFS